MKRIKLKERICSKILQKEGRRGSEGIIYSELPRELKDKISIHVHNGLSEEEFNKRLLLLNENLRNSVVKREEHERRELSEKERRKSFRSSKSESLGKRGELVRRNVDKRLYG